MSRRALSRLLLLAIVYLWPLPLAFQAAAQPPALAEAAREAAKNFQAASPQELAKAKADLTAAIDNLDRFLRRSAAAAATKSWKVHLQWDELVALPTKDQPASAELLSAILNEFNGKSPDLKLQQFIKLHEALEAYAAAIKLPADDKIKDEYVKRMEALAKQLEAYAKDPASGDAALAIGNSLGWLAEHRQAPQLVASVRKAYGQSNFFGYASQRLAAAGIEDNI